MKVFVAVVTSICLLAASKAPALNITFQYADSQGEGFYHPTLGGARRAAWEYAVNLWAYRLEGTRTIRVSAAFNNLGTGDYAILGKAGSNYIYRDFPGAIQRGTWYGDALADQLSNSDLSPGEADVLAQFNDQVDTLNALGGWTFYYGLDENVPPYTLSFVRLAMHELSHGLGFSTSIKKDGSMPDNSPGAYDRFLVLDKNTKSPITSMSLSQRASAIKSNNVYFNGGKAISEYGKLPPVYAPDIFYAGSSLSHLDYLAYSPAQLMEPILMGNSFQYGLSDDVLSDIGWKLKSMPLVSFTGRRLTNVEDFMALGSTLIVEVELSSSAVIDTSVGFVTDEEGGAVSGRDYLIETASPVIIPKGETKASIRVRALTTATGGSSFTLNLTSPVGAELGDVLTRTVVIQGTSAVGDEWLLYQ